MQFPFYPAWEKFGEKFNKNTDCLAWCTANALNETTQNALEVEEFTSMVAIKATTLVVLDELKLSKAQNCLLRKAVQKLQCESLFRSKSGGAGEHADEGPGQFQDWRCLQSVPLGCPVGGYWGDTGLGLRSLNNMLKQELCFSVLATSRDCGI